MSGTIADRIQTRIWRGLGKAARPLGTPHALYRPTGPTDPLAAGNRVATGLLAVFDARPALKFQVPALHDDPMRYLIVDGTQVRAGDYLVGAEDGTHFVAHKPPLQPIVAVHCNATVSLLRLGDGASTGEGHDWGVVDPAQPGEEETALLSGWPASLRFGGRGSGGQGGDLPGGQPVPQYTLLLPAVPGVARLPRPGDVVADDQGRRLDVGWIERSPLGWRMLVRLLEAT